MFIYPNPTQDWIYVENTNSNVPISSIRLYDIEGRMIGSWDPDHFKYYLMMNKYSDGMYFMHILIDGKLIVKKIVKQ